jgi:hypothetical protein
MTIKNLISQELTEGNKTSLSQVDFPPELTETFGSLYQNASSPVVFSASTTTPTPWNAANAGVVSPGNANKVTLDTTTGELILDEPGDYELQFEGSVASDNPSVQLCAQIFIDGVGQDNMCDFPTTPSVAGKTTSFSGGDITLSAATAGQKVGLRFLSVETQDENIKLININLRAKKKKK